MHWTTAPTPPGLRIVRPGATVLLAEGDRATLDEPRLREPLGADPDRPFRERSTADRDLEAVPDRGILRLRLADRA